MVIKQAKSNPTKRVELWDKGKGGKVGLGIRIGKKKSWFFKYYFEGRTRRLTLGEFPALSLENARLKAQEATVSVQNNIDPGVTHQQKKQKYSKTPTIEKLIQELYDKKLSGLKSGNNTKRLLEKDLKPWKDRKVSTIETRDVSLLLDRVAERAPITRNRLHTAMNKLFNFAATRGIINISPCTGIEREEEETRDRFLKDEEIILLWHALDLENRKPFDAYLLTKLALKMILLTGQRPGEVAGMELKEIREREDGTWWEIPAERMKGKKAKPHDVPLSPLVVEIIEQAKFYSGKSRFVFRSNLKKNKHLPVRAISRAVVRHLDDLKIEKFTPHDLRRTCRTGLADLKVSDIVAEKILSHKLQGVLGVYNRAAYKPERRAALILWENHILDLVNPEPKAGKEIIDLNLYRVSNS